MPARRPDPTPAHPEAAQVIGLYQCHGAEWAADRGLDVYEAAWLDRFRALLPAGARVLDLGCGPATTIAPYLAGRDCRITGVDTAPVMLDLARDRLPGHTWNLGDMRDLALEQSFDGILAWDSFFHLSPGDQRSMFPRFRAHAAPGAALMYTSGPALGEAIGQFRGEPLYHASLDPAEYRSLLAAEGFAVVRHVAEDPDCGGRTVWLARLGLDGREPD